jgi:hypothetical protein
MAAMKMLPHESLGALGGLCDQSWAQIVQNPAPQPFPDRLLEPTVVPSHCECVVSILKEGCGEACMWNCCCSVSTEKKIRGRICK